MCEAFEAISSLCVTALQVSLTMRLGNKYVHHNFATALLNDLFGIQVQQFQVVEASLDACLVSSLFSFIVVELQPRSFGN